jgi:hypothetical protein
VLRCDAELVPYEASSSSRNCPARRRRIEGAACGRAASRSFLVDGPVSARHSTSRRASRWRRMTSENSVDARRQLQGGASTSSSLEPGQLNDENGSCISIEMGLRFGIWPNLRQERLRPLEECIGARSAYARYVPKTGKARLSAQVTALPAAVLKTARPVVVGGLTSWTARRGHRPLDRGRVLAIVKGAQVVPRR